MPQLLEESATTTTLLLVRAVLAEQVFVSGFYCNPYFQTKKGSTEMINAAPASGEDRQALRIS